jgi:hypothetical protein
MNRGGAQNGGKRASARMEVAAPIPFSEAIRDPHLLGAGFGDLMSLVCRSQSSFRRAADGGGTRHLRQDRRGSLSAGIASGGTMGNPYCQIQLFDADNFHAQTANGSDGVFIWGAQLEDGASATTYNPNL